MTETLADYQPGVRTAGDAAAYDAFLLRMGARDRAAVERHVAVCEAEATGDHAQLWKRLACLLSGLASKAVATAGQRAVQFFAPDGKYRRQTFALEDLRDGSIAIYMPDVLGAAILTGELRGPTRKPAEPGAASPYALADDPMATIDVLLLTAANVAGAPDYYRHMVGWGRTVLKVILPTSATAGQYRAAQILCVSAGRQNPGTEEA